MARTKKATKKAHRLIDQAAVQASTLVDQAAVQASTLADQMAPHVEAARERVVTEYVPQAKKAGRKARKQVVEEYVPQARAALEDARGAITTAATTAAAAAAAKSPITPKPKKKRGRTVLKLAVLAGIGTALGQWLRKRNVSPTSMYEAPQPTAVPEVPQQPGAALESDDLQQLEGETPVTPATTSEADDSLNTFFDEVMNASGGKGSRRG